MIRRLRQAIGALNREGRERLIAAFDVVNGHFQRLFGVAFGGGEAELAGGFEDPLDAGLEISARPPGKKPQVMTLLSGGEQALTATALIFAVFLTNPSPICVLDEVDAPLDDANVERYCDLLVDMARNTETRFILITHNPITMARMERLFGVTMAERGVSQDGLGRPWRRPSASATRDKRPPAARSSPKPGRERPRPAEKCHICSRNAARLSHLARIYRHSNALDIICLP